MAKKPRAEVLQGTTVKIKSGCGNMYTTLNRDDDNNLYELFCQIGKRGGCASAWSEALGRIITKAIRCEQLTADEVIRQLRGISCHQPVFAGRHGKVLSCPDAIGKALEIYLKKDVSNPEVKADKEEAVVKEEVVPKVDFKKVMAGVDQVKRKVKSGACPDCGAQLIHEEGCEKCTCGFTRC
jgi:ribonucleoside-diphosphate reductase alpha chain